MQTLIEVNKLSVKYNKTDRLAIKDISFSINYGSINAILGPSGCGKTTFLNAISGQFGPKEATISGQIKINNPNSHFTVNMVFQKPTLLAWRSVFKNVAFGLEVKKISREQAREKVREAIAMVGLEDYEKSYPHELSLGMQQRVNFARALVCRPDLLLLDEPFSALDAATKKKIQDDFSRIIKKNKITAVFVTHDMAEAVRLADKLIIFSKGPAEVKAVMENGNFSGLAAEEKSLLDEADPAE